MFHKNMPSLYKWIIKYIFARILNGSWEENKNDGRWKGDAK